MNNEEVSIVLIFFTVFLIVQLVVVFVIHKAKMREQKRLEEWEAEKYLMMVRYYQNGGTYKGKW